MSFSSSSSRTPATGSRSTAWSTEMEAFWTRMTCCVMWWMTKTGWVKVCQGFRGKGSMCLHNLFICLLSQTATTCFTTSSHFHFPLAKTVWNFVHKALAVLQRVSRTCAHDYTCLLLLSRHYQNITEHLTPAHQHVLCLIISTYWQSSAAFIQYVDGWMIEWVHFDMCVWGCVLL